MSVDLYSRSLISQINSLKPHLQACSAFVLQAILIWFKNIATFLHLWLHKLGSIPQTHCAAQFNNCIIIKF